MKMTNLNSFITQLNTHPDAISFYDCIAVIDNHFHFTPVAFSNGKLHNAAGQNNASCKIFGFGLLHQLTEAQVLACFGDYYRIDVLENPAQTSHSNIRQFMRSGWDGIQFSANPLSIKNDNVDSI